MAHITRNYCCMDCGGYIHRQNKNGICIKCNKKGKSNPNYKQGKTLNLAKCTDCKKNLKSYRGKRCKKCANKFAIIQSTGRKGTARYGKDNPNWHGGIAYSIYPITFSKELKELIRLRDGHTCQECEKSEKELNYHLCIHHIDYNKNNNLPHNLISLCKKCHSKTNGKREYWQKKFSDKNRKIINYNFDVMLHDLKNLVYAIKIYGKEMNDSKRNAIGDTMMQLGDKLFKDGEEFLISQTILDKKVDL